MQYTGAEDDGFELNGLGGEASALTGLINGFSVPTNGSFLGIVSQWLDSERIYRLQRWLLQSSEGEREQRARLLQGDPEPSDIMAGPLFAAMVEAMTAVGGSGFVAPRGHGFDASDARRRRRDRRRAALTRRSRGGESLVGRRGCAPARAARLCVDSVRRRSRSVGLSGARLPRSKDGVRRSHRAHRRDLAAARARRLALVDAAFHAERLSSRCASASWCVMLSRSNNALAANSSARAAA